MNSDNKLATRNFSDPETVLITSINDSDRIRVDMGDLNALAKSIKEFGVIQPIVLQQLGDEGNYLLVAGGRRLAALRLNGYTVLRHGKEFIWRDEDLSTPEGHMRLQAVELEENLKRQSLHWSEEVAGKQRLLTIMQGIYGSGGSGQKAGFTQKHLAGMLGESESVTSRDLDLAGYIQNFPDLAKMASRSDAQRRLQVAITVAAMKSVAKQSTAKIAVVGTPLETKDTDPRGLELQPFLAPQPRWTLYEGPFEDNISKIPDSSTDLVVTDLPYNIGLGNSTASHSGGLSQFTDDNLDINRLCTDVAIQAFRILRPNRFGVFFYGMAYHVIFMEALIRAGFTVDTYPFIWVRDRTAPPDGSSRYAKTYDPAFICSKGNPRFIRPNQGNSIAIPSVRGADRLHASQKPLAIMEKFILDMSVEDSTVVDMFAGAGTTGEAALRNKRKCILFELEHSSCEIIKARLGVIK